MKSENNACILVAFSERSKSLTLKFCTMNKDVEL